jgi:hypothetical protein
MAKWTKWGIMSNLIWLAHLALVVYFFLPFDSIVAGKLLFNGSTLKRVLNIQPYNFYALYTIAASASLHIFIPLVKRLLACRNCL